MSEKMVGMELVGTANTLRRLTFQDGANSSLTADGPTSTQQWFLFLLWENKDREVFQKDLEAVFKIRRSTATEILKAMERKKLIFRVPCAKDKRTKRIFLTEQAKAICQENQRRMESSEQRIIRGLSDNEIKTFLSVLKKIQNNIEDI